MTPIVWSVRAFLSQPMCLSGVSQAFDDYTIYVRTLAHTHEYVSRVIAERDWHRTTPIEDTVEYIANAVVSELPVDYHGLETIRP